MPCVNIALANNVPILSYSIVDYFYLIIKNKITKYLCFVYYNQGTLAKTYDIIRQGYCDYMCVYSIFWDVNEHGARIGIIARTTRKKDLQLMC